MYGDASNEMVRRLYFSRQFNLPRVHPLGSARHGDRSLSLVDHPKGTHAYMLLALIHVVTSQQPPLLSLDTIRELSTVRTSCFKATCPQAIPHHPAMTYPKLCMRVQEAACLIDSDRPSPYLTKFRPRWHVRLQGMFMFATSCYPLSSLGLIQPHATHQHVTSVANFRVVARAIVTSLWVAETASVLVSALATVDSVQARSVLERQTSLDLTLVHDTTTSTVLDSRSVVLSTVVEGTVVARRLPLRTIWNEQGLGPVLGGF